MESNGKYQGVILAAGHGSRMGPFGKMFPKPIVPICNKPLLAYQMEYMRQIGIEDVLIVIGHLGYRITQVLGDGSQFGVHIRYVEQERRLGIAHAVGQLEPYIKHPFMLFLGDIFFELPDLREMVNEMEQHGASAVLAVKEETDPEAVKRNFAVIQREDGSVRRVIEKPRHLPNMLKGCGLYLFDLPIFDAIRRTPRTAMRDEYELTDSIQILIDYDYPVRVSPVVEWDINVTYIGDLIRCSRHVLEKTGRRSLVGSRCRLAEGVQLCESVLGDDVTVEKPIRLERCVVLSGVDLRGEEDYCDCVITRDGVLRAFQEA
ncbi:MAG TPA: sugar phosphate nucleotidyltransferase [Candidatus Hydrogenedentes bacterium]|nr:sugar phosphate nucleotidyltransferase [Candidatus Hydrogenedentota bacterium]HOV73629.1 sugar phosphate nucleotidyltransferase [Candidatus Hydrogenedentota bacterium]HPC16327.1 sugar phosphate nucleotidyltransferase [Candidatus Hydrogenedentota bacterium]HRT20755.1 sugar phosphate nucleotidyltransferase [Candidatus Hydrogenedentota bacterium]HRT66757.1 sugar phosphate nucleotidyltransferase [Candidatus Hydrogenedentota bacterium]